VGTGVDRDRRLPSTGGVGTAINARGVRKLRNERATTCSAGRNTCADHGRRWSGGLTCTSPATPKGKPVTSRVIAATLDVHCGAGALDAMQSAAPSLRDGTALSADHPAGTC
jgi:hypothetical protein